MGCNLVADPCALTLGKAAGRCFRGRSRLFQGQRAAHVGGQLPNTDRIGDRSLALPSHSFIEEDEVRFVVGTLKDAATNVGAGAAIY